MTVRYHSLEDWLRWQEGLHPNVIDLGLARAQAVADILFGKRSSQASPFTITVAGTNGKGSCVKTLSALLVATGKRVGAFTSPHLLRYNERICIDNREVSDDDLCEAFAAIDTARGDISLTYFEFNALAALYLFRKHRVDVQVLEVGLGGRLDAVNIVDADIAVITNIALDHVDWLGDTREKIGAEKAGILRQNGKLVYGEMNMPDSIHDRVDALGVTCRQLGAEFGFTVTDNILRWKGIDAAGKPVHIEAACPTLPLPSVACALQVLAWMDSLDADIAANTLPLLKLDGRFERIAHPARTIILDVAHNIAGAHFLADRILRVFKQPVDILFAAMADKDLVGICTALQPAVKSWHLASLPDNSRAAAPEQLQHAVRQSGSTSQCDIYDSVHHAMDACTAQSHDEPLLVCGSFFTVAAAKAYWLAQQHD